MREELDSFKTSGQIKCVHCFPAACKFRACLFIVVISHIFFPSHDIQACAFMMSPESVTNQKYVRWNKSI